MTTDRSALDGAIEDLYRAFAGRPLRRWTDPCLTCCATEEEEAALHAAPLRQLSVDALSPYAENLTTWGDERELNHLFPRMFELATQEDYFPIGVETFGTAISRARPSWSTAEQRAADRAFLELWRAELGATSPVYQPDELLCTIGWASDDLGPHLSSWASAGTPTATMHLVRLLGFGWDPWRADLDEPFWQTRGDDQFPRRAQMDQIVAWMLGPDPWRMLDAAVERGDEPADEIEEALLILTGTTGAARPQPPRR